MDEKLKECFGKYLNCMLRFFEPMQDDTLIMNSYLESKGRGEKEGFVPVLIQMDKTLLECFIMNSCEKLENNFEFDLKKIDEYRNNALNMDLSLERNVIDEMLFARKKEAENFGLDWERDVIGKVKGGYINNRFLSYWNYGTKNTYPLILAEIPVKNPWAIFAWLPFGGWNECPNKDELMVFSKHWFENYGAVPAVMSHDVIEFYLTKPVEENRALRLAEEHYAFCPDVADGSEGGTVGALASGLKNSRVWYFWWD